MSFNRLTQILGFAPSELPVHELLERLLHERDRVRKTIASFALREQQEIKRKTSTHKGGKPATKLSTLMRNAGVTLEDLMNTIEQLKKEKGLTE